jgi:hypothetical protein
MELAYIPIRNTNNGVLIKKNIPTAVQTTALFKDATKMVELERLTIEISTGKVFYVDPISRTDIGDAIALSEELGQTTTIWKLAEPINGSKFNEVTLSELKEARLLGLQAKGDIISQ